MQVVIFTTGTEGDVRPLVALGAGIKAIGDRVRIAAHSAFRDLIERHGLEFAELDGDFRGWMQRDQRAMGRALNLFGMLAEFHKQLRDMAENWPEQGLAAAQDADLIIGNGMVSQLGIALGQKLDIAHVETQLVPSFPSSYPPPIPLPSWMYGLPPQINYCLGWLARLSLIYAVQPVYDDHVRPRLGLPPLGLRSPYSTLRASHLRLVGVSPSLISRHPRWPDNIRLTGQWTLPPSEGWQPPEHLRQFLEIGEKPVYIGFGSMQNAEARTLTALFLDVLKATGKRAVLATGWGGLDGVENRSCAEFTTIDHAPHEWLFDRVSFAVHHGGAGTTHAAARAGIASIVMPVFGDQPFWASRLHRLGAAPSPIPRPKARFHQLVEAFYAASDTGMQAQADRLGRRIRMEDGVAEAIRILKESKLIG